MFLLKKSKHTKSVFVIEDEIEIDQIHYENIDELCEILKKYYSEQLLQEKYE